jgi:hypothetical protein
MGLKLADRLPSVRLSQQSISWNKALLEIFNGSEWSSQAIPQPGCVMVWHTCLLMPQQDMLNVLLLHVGMSCFSIVSPLFQPLVFFF